MFFDIGPLELVTIVLLAVIIFGPDKLPKLIQDVSRMIRKLREFSDNAKEDIRKELGPEFRDFEFEDLNPKTFVRKNLLDDDAFGLRELHGSLSLRDEMAAVTDTVKETHRSVLGAASAASLGGAAPATRGAAPRSQAPLSPDERPPFDADAT